MKGKAFALLKWWITFALICLGFALFVLSGLIKTVNEADATKLSFLILTVFMIYSVRVGRTIKAFNRLEMFALRRFDAHVKWVAAILLDIGMIGTVIGFILMLSVSFGHIEVTNTASLRVALQNMGVGMSTALYTTAAGLVCSLLLRLQLQFLEGLLGETA